MYKNGLSSYQIKKEKLKRIKEILIELKNRQVRISYVTYEEEEKDPDIGHMLQTIWEIVKGE